VVVSEALNLSLLDGATDSNDTRKLFSLVVPRNFGPEATWGLQAPCSADTGRTSTKEIAGLDHDYAGSAAVGMAVIQPEQGHNTV
jgi:hypothetical protein